MSAVKLGFNIINVFSTAQRNLLEELPVVIDYFQKNKGSWITVNCQKLLRGNVCYYGIRKEQQMQKSVLSTRKVYQQMKFHVLQNMGLNPKSRVIQVVGDSVAFSLEGTIKAKKILRQYLSDDVVVLYGYTSYLELDGTRCANGAVTDVILEKKLQKNSIANLVGFHTSSALKFWGCKGLQLQNYMLVYGDDETCRERGTVFGDDVITSDYFADKMILLEGGAQSFRQVCNALLLDQEIIILSGLRSSTNAFDPDGTPYFTASKFIRDIFLNISQKKLDVRDLQSWYKNYFGKGKCYIANPQKPDFDTKQKLLDEAWDLFIRAELYKKTLFKKEILRSRL